jgi:DNA-binding Lrp family transcriptional regulator
MLQLEVDAAGQRLLSLLQREFPIARRPYRGLAEKLDTGEDEIISQVKELKAKGLVRLIGPVMDARRLGYQSTLIAMKVTADRLEQAERVVAEHSGVSHGYEREHDFNVWFTLSLPHTITVADELRRLALVTGAEAAISLPARRLFKIGAYFDNESVTQPAITGTRLPEEVELCPDDRKVINALPLDLPLTPAPFEAISEEAGIGVEELLARCRSLVERGVIRRFSASVNHRRVGFQANAMTCWAAPSEKVDPSGWELASLKAVSHCYERDINPLWKYNLFAMLHCQTRDACREMVDEVSLKLGLQEYVMLFSTREFKKTRVKYLV